jgi:hypothetical protein
MFMKLTRRIGSAILLLAFGIATPAFAQDQHDQDHPAKPQDAKPADKPKQQTEPAKTPNDEPRPAEKNQAKPPKEPQPKAEQPKTTAPSRQKQADDQDRARAQQKSEHAKPQQDPAHQQTAQQHGRIPDDKFRASFGREHTFHVGHPQIAGGRPRFSYGGYSFFISEAWPSGWGYDDDVYIIEVNGVYYLLDDAHPGVQLELVIG